MDNVRRPPRQALAIAFAVLLVPVAVGSAAAVSSAPTVVIEPTVIGANVSLSLDANRTPKQIASCTSILDSAVTVSCGAATPQGTKASRYTITVTNQTVGGHNIVVTVTLTDGGVLGNATSFTINPERVFARAWTNLDGIAGYQPSGADVLIAELVDSNRDDQVDAGDTVTTNRYPLAVDFATAGFGTFHDTSHTVASLGTLTPTMIWAFDASGNRYSFLREFGGNEYYDETTPGSNPYTVFWDSTYPFRDQVWVNPTSSSPDVLLPDIALTPGGGDDPFVDVELNLP